MSDPDLTPAQEESVRALLAAARHTQPTPDDVVARLDATLASLVAERREVRAPVVTLASRRRRRTANALLAAAAVVVLGVGVTQVLPSHRGSSDSTASSAESSEDFSGDAAAAPGAGQEGPAEGDLGSAGTELARPKATDPPPALDGVTATPSLTSTQDLKPQLRDLRHSLPRVSYLAPSCLSVDAGATTAVRVTYDNRPGVAVYRSPVAGHQQVDLYLCGASTPLKSVQLRAP